MSDRNLVVFGDSVTWGQGHLDKNKFAIRVADARSLHVRMFAHSGAIIGVGDSQTGGCGPEAPNHYPTILQQLAAAADDPQAAAVVLVDGGINDVSIQTILNPFTTDKSLKRLTRRYCHDDLSDLLTRLLARYSSQDTIIVVTSYFPIFSHKSQLDGVLNYLAGMAIAPPIGLRTLDEQRAFALRSVDLALLFWTESQAQLQAAVAEMKSPRVVLADVPFTEDNAMFTGHPWLFNVHLKTDSFRLVPEDDVIALRHEQCVKCHPNDPLGLAVSACDIASAGHPNVIGAEQFATTILGVLGRSTAT